MNLFLLISMMGGLLPIGVYGAYQLSTTGRLNRRARNQQKRFETINKTSEEILDNFNAHLEKQRDNYIESYRTSVADSLPIQSLKAFGASKVRWTTLAENGYQSVGDLIRSPDPSVISGVGAVSEEKLKQGLNNALTAINNMEIPEPKAEDRFNGKSVLLAAQQKIECQQALKEWERERESFVHQSQDLKNLTFRTWIKNPRRTSRRAQSKFDNIEAKERSLIQIEEKSRPKADGILEPKLHEEVLEIVIQLIPGGSAARALYGALSDKEREKIRNFPLNTEGLDIPLRPYQVFGAKFCLEKQRVLLGDEMGLGKTIQALAVMHHLSKQPGIQHFLVLAPAGVVYNWIHEIQSRTTLSAFAFIGSQRSKGLAQWHRKGGVLVSSYSTARSSELEKHVSKIDLFVADEAHYIKNLNSRRTKEARAIGKKSDRIILMTGTPIENQTSDFVNLIEPLDLELAEELRGETKDLEKQLVVQTTKSILMGAPSAKLVLILMNELRNASSSYIVPPKEFHHLVRNTYLRRNQMDVLRELPECIETQSWVEMSVNDLVLYKKEVEKGNFMGMRRVCGRDSKLELLGALIEEFRYSNQKVIIFSYFRENLDQIEARFPDIAARIDGSVSNEERMERIEGFRKVDGHAIMIAQIVAAGVGINLQFASAVVLFEPQIKPSIEDQAIARVKRMGQTKRVLVHRLLCENSVDTRMLEILERKREDFDAYAKDSIAKEGSEINKGEIKRILNGEAKRLGLVMADLIIDSV